MKYKKKRRIPRNPDCLLTKKERAELCDMLDTIEWDVYVRIKHLTSAYADAEVEEYDELEVLINVTWGCDTEGWSDEDTTTISRNLLNKTK